MSWTKPMLGDHLDLFRCSVCGGKLSASKDLLECVTCRTAFGEEAGFVNFAPEIPARSTATQPSKGQRWMEDPKKVGQYEERARVFFVRAMGKTWLRGFTHETEDAYLLRFVEPHSDDAVFDVACGAGRWTRVLAERFGANRIIGLDLSYAMLAVARRAVPAITLVRGSATKLPLADASVGAVNCWNAIQALPDPQQAIREMSRVLKPGGTFTCLTYLKSTGPYRWVQSLLERQVGSIIVGRSQFRQWIENAELNVEDETLVGQVVMLTARRR